MIPIAKPMLGEEEAEAARKAILSGWVTQGPMVQAFEEAFAAMVGARFACAVSNCTTAMHLALLAAGVRPGDVVITVSHSFVATANAVRHCSAEPVFVDVEPETFNMDPAELERVLRDDCLGRDGSLYYRNVERLSVGESPLVQCRSECTGRVAAIMPVHQMGLPCDMGRINSVAKRYGLPVVEDAACAAGSRLSCDNGATWDMIGRPHGDMACFSFHPRKLVTTGEGGMITTNSSSLDQACRLLRQHGMSVPDTVRHGSPQVIFEDYEITGFNYRMSDIQAAVGVEQLKKLGRFVEERRLLAGRYRELLSACPGAAPLKPGPCFSTNWQSYPVRLRKSVRFDQREVMQRLLDLGISTRRGIMNAHQEPPYLAAGWQLPNSETCRDRTILLPLYNGMSVDDAARVADALATVLS